MTRPILIRQLRERAAQLDAEWLRAFWDVTADNVPEYEALDAATITKREPTENEQLVRRVAELMVLSKRARVGLAQEVNLIAAGEIAKRDPAVDFWFRANREADLDYWERLRELSYAGS